jgi:hypothetical protein
MLWLWWYPVSATGAAAAGVQPNADAEFRLKLQQYRLSQLGLAGTAIAIGFGLLQYWKAERWKRAEFLAREMKEFFADPQVRNVLMMIDWSPRRIDLFGAGPLASKRHPLVTRALQISALRPHPLLAQDGGSDAEADAAADDGAAEAPRRGAYSQKEARIRDAYDRFLDWFERFGSYVESRLVRRQDLDPYLRYWIDDIVAFTTNAKDAEWTCALLGYVQFYRFENVHKLFDAFGYDIRLSGGIFRKHSAAVPDQEMPRRLLEVCQAARE